MDYTLTYGKTVMKPSIQTCIGKLASEQLAKYELTNVRRNGHDYIYNSRISDDDCWDGAFIVCALEKEPA